MALGGALGLFRGDGAMGGAEEVAQSDGVNAVDAHEDPRVIQVVVSDEVGFGVGGDHVVALVDRHSDD